MVTSETIILKKFIFEKITMIFYYGYKIVLYLQIYGYIGYVNYILYI
jgi:hypothetical protein